MEESAPQNLPPKDDIMTPLDSLEGTTQMNVTPTVGTSLDGGSVAAPAPNRDPVQISDGGETDVTEAALPANRFAEFWHNKLIRRVSLASGILLGLIAILVIGTLIFQKTHKVSLSQAERVAQIKDQSVNLKDTTATAGPASLRVGVSTFFVNGDASVQGVLRFSNGSSYGQFDSSQVSGSQTYKLPNSSGTICLDSGNCSFASASALAAVQNAASSAGAAAGAAQATALATQYIGGSGITVSGSVITNSGVLSVNGSVGAINLQGTANQIAITNANGTISLALPQDIGLASTPTFGGLVLNSVGTQNGFNLCDSSNNCSYGINSIVQGGNGFGTDVIVGANDNSGLQLITNNTTRLSITNNGVITLGGANSDRITALAQFSGGTPLVFQGATDDFFTTSLVITNPTSNRNIILPNADGTVCLSSGNCSGAGGYGDVLNGGNNFNSTANLGTNDNFGLNLKTNNVTRFMISNTGATTLLGNVTSSADAILGTNSSNRLTINSQISGATPFVFQGATNDSFTTTFTITDPTANRNITFPNADGTVCLSSGNCTGPVGTGDVLQGGNNFGGTMVLGSNDNFGFNLKTNNTNRLTISNTGAAAFTGDLSVAGNNVFGTNSANRITFNGEVLGGAPLVFQGATDNAFATFLLVADPTATRTITLPNADGTICLSSGNCTTSGGSGDVNNGGNNFNSTMSLGTNDNFGLNLKTNNTTRLSISNGGQVTVQGNFVVNGDTLLGATSAQSVTMQAQNLFAPNDLNIDTYTQYIDTTNNQVGFGTLPLGTARVGILATNGGDGLTVNNGLSAGNIANFQDNGVNVVTIANEGATTFRNATNSVAAFQVQNAAGATIVNTDTTNRTLNVNGGPSTYSFTASGPLLSPKVDYTVGANPLGATYGDFNGDGFQDLAIVNSGSNTVSILMNNGNGTFANKVDYTTGVAPFDVISADFNGDGKPDIAVVNNSGGVGGGRMSVFINNGNGTFAAKVDYVTSDGPYSIVTGDFNSDGKADLAVMASSSNAVSVFMGNGNGTFAAKVDYSAGNSPSSLTTADFNGDGKLDLALASPGTSSVSVLMNNGNGTFGAAVNYPGGGGAQSIHAVDLNGDGFPDLTVANLGANTISVFMNNGNGTFGAKVDYTSAAGPIIISNGDINGDGHQDVVVANVTAGTISVFINNGNGTLSPKVDFTSGGGPRGLAITDFNGDGKTDVVASNNNGGVTASVFLGNGTTTTIKNSLSVTTASAFNTALFIKAAANQSADLLRVADSNGNNAILSLGGTGSLFVKNTTDSTTALQLQNVAGTNVLTADTTNSRVGVNLGTFVTPSNTLTVNGITTADSLAQVAIGTGSVTNKGLVIQGVASQSADLFQTQTSTGAVTASIGATGAALFKNSANSTTAFQVQNAAGSNIMNIDSTNRTLQVNGGPSTYTLTSPGALLAAKVDYTTSGGAGGRGAATGDFNGDTWPDLVYVNKSAGTISVLMNNGNGTFAAPVNYTAGTAANYATVADFNGDGKPDIAVSNNGVATVSVFINNGDGTFAAQATYAIGAGAQGITSADFNGDGKPDIAVNNQTDGTVSVLINNGNGTFATQVTYAATSGPRMITAADFNNDGKPDLAVAVNGGNKLGIFLNNGNGTFAAMASYTSGTGPFGVTAGDYNGDGFNDVAVGNTIGTISVFMNNGNGTFAPKVDYAAATTAPDGMGSADLTGDGKADIIVANAAAGSSVVSVYANNGNGTFAARQDVTAGNQPFSVAIADYNKDGKLDVATGNNSTPGISVYMGTGSSSTVKNSLSVTSAGTTDTSLYIKAVSSQTGDLIRVADSSGNNPILSLSATGSFLLHNSTDSTTAFLLQNVAGGYTAVADTVNNRFGINTGSIVASNTLTVNSATTADSLAQVMIGTNATTNKGLVLQGVASQTANLFEAQDSTGTVVASIGATGTATLAATAASSNLGTLTLNSPGLPDNFSLGASVSVNGYVYAIGGSNGAAKNSVYYGKLNPDGTVSAWTTSGNTLPVALFQLNAVATNGYIYAVGGTTGGGSTVATVYYSKVNSDGSIGAWTATTSLPAVRSSVSIATANGYVYVVGGTNGTSPQNTVYYAQTQSDGTLGAWTTSGNTLPAIRSSTGYGVANGFMYVIGGTNGTTAQNTVYYAALNSDGTVGAWTTSGSTLPGIRSGTTAVIANNNVFVFGGLNAGVPQASIYTTTLNANGTVNAWTTATATVPLSMYQTTAVAANGYAYLFGGYDGTTLYGRMYYARLPGLSTGAVVNSTSTSIYGSLQIQNADGTSLLFANNIANTITVGAPSENPTLFVLGTKTSAGDPAGTNGAMYYNTNTNKFRCYENNAWINCSAAGGAGTGDITHTGNAFGSAITIGSIDNQTLSLITNNVARATFDTSGNLYLGNGVTAASPSNFSILGTGSSTAGTTGGAITIRAGAGASTGVGSNGGIFNFYGGDAGGSGNNNGGGFTLNGGQGINAGNGGGVSIQGGGADTGLGGNVTIDGGTSLNSTNGTVSIGTNATSALSLGKNGINTTLNGSSVVIGNLIGSTSVTLQAGTGNVQIGNATADGTGTLLVLDTKNTAGDPTGAAGGMYYNSSIGKFRCYENGAWANCIGAAGAGSGDIVHTGNNFGAPIIIGSLDAQTLSLYTNNVARATFDTSGNIYLGNGVTNAAPAASAIIGTGSSAATVAGSAISITGGAGNTSGAGGAVTITGGTPGTTGNGGALTLKSGAGGATSGTSGAVVLQSGNVSLGASGSVTVDNGSSASGSPVFSLGGTNARTISLGNTTAATTTSIQGGTGASAIGIQAGAGGIISIGTTANNSIAIGSTATTIAGTIAIGSSAQTGTITLGQSTSASGQTLNIQNGATTGTTAVNILSGAGSAGTASLLMGNNARVTQIDLGNVAAAAARTINIGTGSNTVGIDTINIGTGATSVLTGKTINIGTGTPTGSGTNSITMGTLTGASTTSIQGGTGLGAIQIQSNGGLISIGTSSTSPVFIGGTAGNNQVKITGGTSGVTIGDGGVANTLQFGNTTGAVTQTINVGTNATASSQTNVTIGSVIGASTTTLQSGTAGVTVSTGAANSTTALQVKRADTTTALVVDTSSNKVNIGTGSVPGIPGAFTLGATSSPTGQGGHAMASANMAGGKFVYLLPGNSNTVYYAVQNADGSLGAWTAGPTLPATLFGTMMTIDATNNYIYVIGGYTSSVSGTAAANKVYYSALNTSTGAPGAWSTSANNLSTAVGLGAAFVSNGKLTVLGGATQVGGYGCSFQTCLLPLSGTEIANTQTSTLTAGAPGAFAGSTALPQALANFGFTTNGFTTYVFGGLDSTNTSATVFYTNFLSGGALGSWTTQPIGENNGGFGQTAAYSSTTGYIYDLGGAKYYNGSSWLSLPSTLLPFGAADIPTIVGSYMYQMIGTSSGLGTSYNYTLIPPATGTSLNVSGNQNNYGFFVQQSSLNATAAFQVQNAGGTGILTVDTTNGAVKINSTGTVGTVEKFRVNTPTTVDNLANTILSANAATSKALVVQGAASQTANLLELQTSTGSKVASFNSNGVLDLSAASGAAPAGTGITLGDKISLGSAGSYTNSYGLGLQNNALVLYAGNSASATISMRAAANGGQYSNGGDSFTFNPTTGAQVNNIQSASAVGLTVKGAVSQTASLQEWQDSTGVALAGVSAAGTLTFNNLGATTSAVDITTGGVGTASILLGANAGYIQKWLGSGNDNVLVTVAPNATVGTPTQSGGLILLGTSYWNGSAAVSENLQLQSQRNSTNAGDYFLQVRGGIKIDNQYSGAVATVVRGASGQVAHLQDWQDYAGIVLASIDASGNMTLNGSLNIATGTLKVAGVDRIDNSGNLVNVTFNGNTIGVGYGGTGSTTFTANGLLFGNGSGAIQATAAGNSGQCLIATTGSAPTWGSCAPASAGNVNQGGNNFGAAVTLGATDNFGINLLANNTAVARFSASGQAVFQNGADSVTALQVQNAGGTSLFTIDSTNSRVYVGNPTADGTGTLLVLDTKNTGGDPTGVNGGMYYNSNLGKFRCYENGNWKDCIYNVRTASKTADQTFSATSYADVSDLSFSVLANKVYKLNCTLLVSVPSGTNGGNLSTNGPASPSQLTATFAKSLDQSSGDNYATSSSYDDASAATTFKVNTVSTGSNRFIVSYNAILVNGVNNGTWSLRSKAFDGSSSITMYANSSCDLRPL